MDILNKLYIQSPQQAIQDIATQREKNGHCVVHFLYFANAIKHNIFHDTCHFECSKAKSRNLINQGDPSTSVGMTSKIYSNYYNTLISADFLLPDGIALQVFYRCAVALGRIQSDRSWLYNCNGTDFTLPLLQFLSKRDPGLVIHLYGGSTSAVAGAQVFLHDQGYVCGAVQDGYTSRNWENIVPFSGSKQVLLVARGTPLQESRIQENMAHIQKNNILVLSVGGLFAFRSGEEKRTPKVFRGRAEWLWRLFANPRKNAIKVRYSLYLPYAIIRYLLLKR